MQKTNTKLTAAIVLALTSASADAEMFEVGMGNNNFTMLTPAGSRVGGTNEVDVMWDGTFNTDVATAVSNMTISSAAPFFGSLWKAHDVKVYAPGSYVIDVCIADGSKVGSSVCDGSDPRSYNMDVAEGQVGVHMLFDWGCSVNIDVINVWDVDSTWQFGGNDGSSTNFIEGYDVGCFPTGKGGDPSTPECQALYATEWMFTATDPDGNGTPGTGMRDGPFIGFNAAFNVGPSAVPVPAAAWLMGSGLLGLVGVARRKKR